MFIIFLLLALISLFVSQKLFGTIFSPIGIFGFIWNIYLLFFEVRLVNYYPLEFTTYVALIGSYFAFTAGVIISVIFVKDQAHLKEFNRVSFQSKSIKSFDFHKAKNVLVFINIVAFIGLILIIFKLQKIVLLSNIYDMNLVRNSMHGLSSSERVMSGFLGYLTSLLPLNAVFCGIFVTYIPKVRFQIFLCFIIGLLISLISGNRAMLIMITFLFISSYIITKTLTKGIKFKRILLPILPSILILCFVFVFIGKIRFAPENVFLKMFARYDIPWAILHPYSYITAGVGAFNILLESLPNFSIPFLHSLAPIIRLLAKIEPELFRYDYETIVYYTVNNVFVPTPLRTNVYTYLGAIFSDFGWAGMFIAPFLIGIISGLVFIRLLRKPTITVIGLYSFFCLHSIYSTVHVITHANTILVSLFFLIILSKYISQGRMYVPR